MEETWNSLVKKQYGNQTYQEFYWINWQSIIDVIDEVNAKESWEYAPTMRFLLTDLMDLLCRKGLVPFHGFSQLVINLSQPEFYFWREKEQDLELLFSGMNVNTLERNVHQYFWEE